MECNIFVCGYHCYFRPSSLKKTINNMSAVCQLLPRFLFSGWHCCYHAPCTSRNTLTTSNYANSPWKAVSIYHYYCETSWSIVHSGAGVTKLINNFFSSSRYKSFKSLAFFKKNFAYGIVPHQLWKVLLHSYFKLPYLKTVTNCKFQQLSSHCLSQGAWGKNGNISNPSWFIGKGTNRETL